MPNMPPEAVAKGVAARARAGAAAAGKDADLHPSQENPSWASKKPSQQAPEGAGQGGGCQGRGQGGRWHGEGAGEGPLAGQRSWAKWRTPAPRAAACDHQKMGALSTSATTTTTSTTSTTSTTAAGTPTTTTATKVPQCTHCRWRPAGHFPEAWIPDEVRARAPPLAPRLSKAAARAQAPLLLVAPPAPKGFSCRRQRRHLRRLLLLRLGRHLQGRWVEYGPWRVNSATCCLPNWGPRQPPAQGCCLRWAKVERKGYLLLLVRLARRRPSPAGRDRSKQKKRGEKEGGH